MAPDRRVLVLHAVLLILLCFALLLQLLTCVDNKFQNLFYMYICDYDQNYMYSKIWLDTRVQHTFTSVGSNLARDFAFFYVRKLGRSIVLPRSLPMSDKMHEEVPEVFNRDSWKTPHMIITVSVQLKTKENEMFTVKVQPTNRGKRQNKKCSQ